VKEWLDSYRKADNAAANTQAIIGYNAVMTLAHYVKLAGKDLMGEKLLVALESATPTRISSVAADQVLQDRPSRNNHHQRAAGEERPLGRGQGRPVLLNANVRGGAAGRGLPGMHARSRARPAPARAWAGDPAFPHAPQAFARARIYPRGPMTLERASAKTCRTQDHPACSARARWPGGERQRH
jgi:hypothetical protein